MARAERAEDGERTAVDIEEAADNLRKTRGVNLGHVNFDIFLEVITEEVEDQIVDKVESIADDNERELVGEFLLLEEIFDLFRFVAVGLSANSLDLFDLVSFDSGLDILEVHVSFLTEINDRSQEVEKTLVALEALEKLDKLIISELFVVFRCDLDYKLQILANVGGEHGAQTLHRVFHGEIAEILHEPVGLEHVRVDDSTLKFRLNLRTKLG